MSDGTYSGKLILHVPSVNTDTGAKRVSMYFVWAFYSYDKLKKKTKQLLHFLKIFIPGSQTKTKGYTVKLAQALDILVDF